MYNQRHHFSQLWLWRPCPIHNFRSKSFIVKLVPDVAEAVPDSAQVPVFEARDLRREDERRKVLESRRPHQVRAQRLEQEARRGRLERNHLHSVGQQRLQQKSAS